MLNKIIVLLAGLSLPVFAQTLEDPTRPSQFTTQSIQGATVKAIHPYSVDIVQELDGEWVEKTLWVAKSGNVKSNAAENY